MVCRGMKRLKLLRSVAVILKKGIVTLYYYYYY